MLVSDYGPTIILEHKVENQIYTIRPPIDSLEDLTLGAVYKKGQQIATLGDSAVNGDYSPHLHFQVIKTWD
jgi:murein DD-endopeptidase MepM/ murein hydrolase activator NlpD